MDVATADSLERFRADGFVLADRLVDESTISDLHERFDSMFAGQFETGLEPDEINWQFGRDDPTLTRQICNGWKADSVVASVVLRADLGEAIARFAGWDGARLIQDNLLWKPPGARPVGFHRDNGYQQWYRPQEMCTCWIALDDTSAASGAIELAIGSHRWPTDGDTGSVFHAPVDFRRAVELAADRADRRLEIVAVEVRAGSGAFHHGWTWHGSGVNRTEVDRRALVVHCGPSRARFERAGFALGTGPIYSRYANADDDEMDERQFPVLWQEDGYRSEGLP